MHLMPHTTLLAASLQYGVVSRSYPLSGKVLRGFLDASGTVNGLGVGNPNAEFSPHVSSIALASEGGTAKVLWGFRNGEVAVTTALRAMDHNRTSAARLVRCRLGDCHEGAVESISWASGGEGCIFFVSGGADGRVKLWEAKHTLNCLWTSNKGASLLPDPCVKVVMDLRQGAISAGLRSGGILAWTGFSGLSAEALDATTLEPRELRIPPPAIPSSPSSSPPFEQTAQELTELHIVPQGDRLSILAAYHPSPFFHRLVWNAAANAFDRTLFGEQDAAPIRALLPVWATRQGESDFVIAGDQLGNVSIFPWHASPSPPPSPSASSGVGTATISAARQFAAHEGAVTALAWNSAVLVSGSARGTVKAWDALTFAPLRTFASPSSRPLAGGEWDPVYQILLERDVVIVSVGSKVLAWKAGPVGKHAGPGKGKLRAASGRNSHGVAKWQQQIEMYRDIAESKRELAEEQTHTRRAFGREKEQLSTLAHLGLSEVEAVEYVLMLSRDEEEARRESTPDYSRPRVGEEGVFIADFDDVPTPMATPSNMFGSEPPSGISSKTSSFSAQSSPGSGSYTNGRLSSRATPAPSLSNHKVQVSPRAHPEPMEAGFSTSSSPQPSRSASSSIGVVPSAFDSSHFPAVSRTPSSTSASGSSARDSAPGSPQSVRSAWSTPLRSLHSSEAPSPSPSRMGGALSPSQSPARSLSGVIAGPAPRAPPVSYAEEDEDLRFAIELSLAEARSRGEDV
ncbi:hypothetical protein L226DRAFT_459056 [Lentinus tigrinus ALCF2SS1-7]|uniref:Uncharacterized protein n=1 Tax=Lentinus tigrinus ALCF2SS1-6 TaxID=1328759 RepID=A0A5C2RRX8_9APHY|nr:hypothetical protein L227DRAFT_512899 [Lentinus tigrinus ALCF2SS1-6]RPD76791.1 hypothetical protein L226DRAFT_459056 [Lentinus tigrinus ALCF2SS1-7]